MNTWGQQFKLQQQRNPLSMWKTTKSKATLFKTIVAVVSQETQVRSSTKRPKSHWSLSLGFVVYFCKNRITARSIVLWDNGPNGYSILTNNVNGSTEGLPPRQEDSIVDQNTTEASSIGKILSRFLKPKWMCAIDLTSVVKYMKSIHYLL